MRFNKIMKITAISLICFMLYQPSAHAFMWFTFDLSAIFQNAKSILQKVDQYKTQIEESKMVTSINKSIGDAKAGLSKLNLDKVQEAKRKADKIKKEKEKIEKTKEKIKKSREEFEKKKEQFNNYKKQIEAARKQVTDTVDEVKSAYEDVKSIYKDAKDTVSAGTALAKQTVNDAKSKDSDAKQTVGNTINKSHSTVKNTVNTGPNRASATTGTIVGNPVVSTGTAKSVATTGRTAFTSAESEKAEIKPSSLPKAESKESVSQAVATARTEGSTAGVAAINRAMATAVAEGDTETLDDISNLDEADIINSDSKIYEEAPALNVRSGRTEFVLPNDMMSKENNKQPEIKEIAPTLTTKEKSSGAEIQGVNPSIQIHNRMPEKLDKESFFLDNGEYVRQSSLKISTQETLKFADVTECSDYSNTIHNDKDGEIFITSETLAKECCFKAENLRDMSIIQDCANKLLEKMNDEDAAIAEEARGTFSVITAEQNAYGLVEAWKDQADSSSYFADSLSKYINDSDIARREGSTNEAIGSIATTNVESLYLLNRIRRIFTSSLVTTAIGNIGSVNAETLKEETEIGLGEVTEDYNYSIIRGVSENAKEEANNSDNSVEYPVIPENFAKKCQIKLDADNIHRVKDCYYQTVTEANDKDFTKAEVGKNFVENIKYQDMLNTLGKSLYQKVKTAKYDDELNATKENIADSSDERTSLDALFKTDVEMQKVLDEIIHIYAARIATSSLENIGQLTPKVENSNNTEGQKNG